LSRNEDGFLSRWARRKQEVRESEEREAALAPDAAADADADAEAQAQALADPDQRDVPPDEETRQRWIDELEAVDIGSLAYESDFTIFMKSWVPVALRQKALRKLWTTNPALAVLDGLNDYDLDYTDKAIAAGKVISSYMPGRGYAAVEEVVAKVEALAGDPEGASEEHVPEFETEVPADTAAAEPAEQDEDAEPAQSGNNGRSGAA
jgi:hypothetical protein